MKIGIIKEGKTPPDSRVPLSPQQCQYLLDKYDMKILVQPSPDRCFSDEEYREAGVQMSDDLGSCDVLLGVKEVPVEQLIPDKKYFFFSHTIKKQPYNQKLLQAIIHNNIQLIDYEVLTDDKGQRLIAFGKFAGMVGAHNGVMAYGKHSGRFQVMRMKDFHDYAAAKESYYKIQLPPFKTVLTGSGRVAGGAAMVLEDMGIKKVSPSAFLNDTFEEAVFTQLDCEDYAAHKDGRPFKLQHFFQHPEEYESTFAPYTKVADVMINGIYWDRKAPAFFTKEEMQSPEFSIKVIADITCDIAPEASIPSTLRAATIAEPLFGYDPQSGQEVAAFSPHSITMMTVDNLPNELPRDASQAFGEQFIEHIIDELLDSGQSQVIERATIAKEGKLGPHFQYLDDYLKGGAAG